MIYLGCSFTFGGFNSITFKDVKFFILSYLITSDFINYSLEKIQDFVPGLFFESVEDVYFFNCGIFCAPEGLPLRLQNLNFIVDNSLTLEVAKITKYFSFAIKKANNVIIEGLSIGNQHGPV